MGDAASEASGSATLGISAAPGSKGPLQWVSGGRGQPRRAWAAAAEAISSWPAHVPPPAALALTAVASSSSDGASATLNAPASTQPHEWMVWTYLPGFADAQVWDGQQSHTRPGGRAWASAATAAVHCLPAAGCGPGSSGLGFSGSECGAGAAGGGSSCGHSYSRCGGGGSRNGSGSGWFGSVGGGRAMMLASLTASSSSSSSSSSSAVAAPAAAVAAPAAAGPSSSSSSSSSWSSPSTAAAAAAAVAAVAGGVGLGAGAGAGLFRGFNLPQISLMPAGRLPGSAASAAAAAVEADQELAAELYDYHVAKHGGFPRPCPRCNSNSFFERGPAPAPASAASSAGASAAEGASSTASGGGGGGGSGEVVTWRSRPLCCDMCGAWVHMACARVDLLEKVPPRPWFHSPVCRNNYIRLEAAAEQNPHASSDSPSSQLYILTPADNAAYSAMAARAAGGSSSSGSSSGSSRGGGGMPGRPRGPAGSVVPLLAQGFNADAIEGFGEPAREYDGGRYSAVLVAERRPVAAATFNVWGRDAQLCMLATAAAARRKGHGAALVADLEGLLKQLGVQRMLVQARRVALPMWLGPRFGYSLVAPEAAEELHAQLPVAYYDCALLEKWL